MQAIRHDRCHLVSQHTVTYCNTPERTASHCNTVCAGIRYEKTLLSFLPDIYSIPQCHCQYICIYKKYKCIFVEYQW